MIGFLATDEGGQPRVRPMSHYISKEGALWFPTFRSSRKAAQIKSNPRVEISFMDRRFQHVRIEASLNITDDIEKKKETWDAHPTLKKYFSGPEDKEFVILETIPSRIEAMFEGSSEYELFDGL